MADISEAMVEALQAAHNLIANTAFDAGESHQWAVAVDEKIQAALALSAAPASAQMDELSQLREALEPFAKACAEYFNDTCPDETPAWYYEDPEADTWGNSLPSKVTVGDFRAAARTLRESLQTAEVETL